MAMLVTAAHIDSGVKKAATDSFVLWLRIFEPCEA